MTKRKRARVDVHDAKAVVARKRKDEEEKLDVGEHGEGKDLISFEAMQNIMSDYTAKEFARAKTSLMITHEMTKLADELDVSIKDKVGHTVLLQGPSGAGITTTLLYIGHRARSKGYLVFPVEARYFVNQADPMTSLIQEFLSRWIKAAGENILKEIFSDETFGLMKKLASAESLSLNEETDLIKIFQVIVKKLKIQRQIPVIFLVDQCNVFHSNRQVIKLFSCTPEEEMKPSDNPVGGRFIDWNTFTVNHGGIFYGFSSACQLMPTARDGNLSLFSRIEPMDIDEFKRFVEFLIAEKRLPSYCRSTHFKELFELCGGIPREAHVFCGDGSIDPSKKKYHQLKDIYMKTQTSYYKTRIQRLLDKEKLGAMLFQESVAFVASLFVGEQMTSAPEVWIASGLVVTKDGFQKLFCPAAEKAILLLFDEDRKMRQVIDIFRNDPSIRWRSLELAVVYLFRRSCGSPIQLYYTDLCGENRKKMTIRADLIQHGGRSAPNANSIPRNTLYVCVRNTPVVDFFIHDAYGGQILIQVSEKSYHEHRAKYDPDCQNVKVYSAALRDRKRKEELKYIYLTPNSSLMATDLRKSQSYRPDVLLVAGDDMKGLFQDLFD